MLTMNSHGVEFSIAGCVREMVRDPNPMSFFSFFFFFSFLSCALYYQPMGTKTTCSAGYGKERTPLLLLPTGAREKAINSSLTGTRPSAHQPRKIGNQTPTKGAEQENHINTRGGINRKTLFRRHKQKK